MTYAFLLPPIIPALCLFVLYRCRWRDYALPARFSRGDTAAAEAPGVSLIVPAHNQAAALRETLTHLLAQDYDPLEVIVVDQHSTDDTRQVISDLQRDHSNLRYTFIPATARQVDLQKLALTLGAKAAHQPWLVLTRPGATPASPQWIGTLLGHATPETDVVMGYAGIAPGKGERGKAATHALLCRALRHMRAAADGRPTGCTTANVALRHAAFLHADAFRGAGRRPGGEGEMLMKAMGGRDNVAVCTAPDATIWLPVPTLRERREARALQVGTDRLTGGNARRYALREALTSWATYAAWLTIAATAALRAHEVAETGHYALQNLATDVPTALLALLIAILAITTFRRATNALGAPRYGLSLALYALRQPWQGLAARWRWAARRDALRRPDTPNEPENDAQDDFAFRNNDFASS